MVLNRDWLPRLPRDSFLPLDWLLIKSRGWYLNCDRLPRLPRDRWPYFHAEAVCVAFNRRTEWTI